MTEELQVLVERNQLLAEDVPRVKEIGLNGLDGSDLESKVLAWLAKTYDVDFSELTDLTFDPDLAEQFPARMLLRHQLLPLRRQSHGIEMATARLFDVSGLEALKLLTGEFLIPVLVPSEPLEKAIKKHLGVGADTLGTLQESDTLQIVEQRDESVDLDEAAQDASIIRFVNQIFADAIEQRTTDIHLEPFQHELRLRYRIDGVLQEIPVPASLKRFQPAIVSRIKILSNLDIAEKRVPQDGRIKLRMNNQDVDVRVSVIPMVHGEALVMRLLSQSSTANGLGEIRLATEDLIKLRNLLKLPHGIILVTGPTGSGKTTTLYAALQEINQSERKIITVEDPVEYQIKGINQIQVAEKSGLTFAKGLRAILRHDPDVILIGEIRDAETARIAVQASLTGHLVFSTLHTNDSPSALTRLIDMGVEPYLVASSVEAVVAQRLVRVLCPHCKQPHHGIETKHALAKQHAEVTFYQPVGCDKCRHTGFSGRRAIFELLEMTDALRQLIMTTTSAAQIRDLAAQGEWKPLGEDGWRLIKDGETTLDELLRVTKALPQM